MMYSMKVDIGIAGGTSENKNSSIWRGIAHFFQLWSGLQRMGEERYSGQVWGGSIEYFSGIQSWAEELVMDNVGKTPSLD